MAGPSTQVKIAQKTWEMANNIMEVGFYLDLDMDSSGAFSFLDPYL